jgi:hypothetical protein
MEKSETTRTAKFIRCDLFAEETPEISGPIAEDCSFEFMIVEKLKDIKMVLKLQFYHTNLDTNEHHELATISIYYAITLNPPLNLHELYALLLDGFTRIKGYRTTSYKPDDLIDLFQKIECPPFEDVAGVLQKTLNEFYYIPN